MSKINLHIAPSDKFLPDFINFLSENFDYSKHLFLLGPNDQNLTFKKSKNIFFLKKNITSLVRVIISMNYSNKIILHGLSDKFIILLLFIQPWLLKKCYWIIWGADLYTYQLDDRNWKWRLKEFFRRSVIKNMGNLVTYIKGDYDKAKEWYDAQGRLHECFMYPSNLYKSHEVRYKTHNTVNILVGNSAYSTNNHTEVFNKLEVFNDQNIRIYVPLSYGDQVYAKAIIMEGKNRFGDKFYPLTKFLPFSEYLELLGMIDIAIFNHKRQQAMGNTITLLGLGTKVYMRSDGAQWDLFKEHSVKVFDINDLDIQKQTISDRSNNRERVKMYFSEKNYKSQLHKLFN